MALTPKQKRFVAEYLVDLNATAAAKRAGYSEKTAYAIGIENLKKPEIQSAIQEAQTERQKRTEITQDMVLCETAKLAFFDVRKMFDKNGKPLEISELDGDTAAALVGLDVQDVSDSDGNYVGFIKKYKMSDKIKALELLGRHFGTWEPKDDSKKNAAERTFEIPARLIAPAFFNVHLDILEHRHSEYVEKGGRGSTKSSFVSLEIVSLIKNNPEIHALCCRKVGNTLRDSVYAQLQWAIEAMGLSDEFDSTKSPLEITYKPTGQKIFFRGADDPHKLKSVKPPFGYIGILWLEELDQFSGDEECRNIHQSAIRGGDKAYVFKSFNPPVTRDNWANQYCEQEKENRLVTHSDYRNVPEQWLGKPFLEEAEHLREVDEQAYRHEYLGEATGTGGNVFEKLELREITDKEAASFDRIFQGLDFGWFPDPLAFIRLHYDRARETIYLLDELYENKLPNEAAARKLKENGYTDAYITCDNAEPKSIADLRSCGLPAKEAVKGPGSVDYGMKWLQKRKIVIDIRRTPHAYDEFVHYEYKRDKNGAFISGYPDEKNHLIDAARYALERVFRRMGVTA